VSYPVYQIDGLTVTGFHGGEHRGPCLQFDAPAPAQMTAPTVRGLILILRGWVREIEEQGGAPPKQTEEKEPKP
jgi:hypothetical protein